MKKTFKRRALVSSVAMLLVAILALGSATFAWFSSNNTVTANGFEMTAATSEGLQIANVNHGASAPLASAYSTGITLSGPGGTWNPVSPIITDSHVTAVSNDVDSWRTGTAANATAYGLNSDGAATAGTDYYAQDIYLKSAKSGSTITVSASSFDDDMGYDRILFVSATSGNAYWMAKSSDSHKELTWSTDKYVEGTTTRNATTTVTFVAADLTALGTGACFHTYFYFEGQDSDCKDVKSGADFDVDLTFTLN